MTVDRSDRNEDSRDDVTDEVVAAGGNEVTGVVVTAVNVTVLVIACVVVSALPTVVDTEMTAAVVFDVELGELLATNVVSLADV